MNNSEQGPSSQQKLNHACRKKILVTMASAAMLFGAMTASKSAGQTAGANTLSSTPASKPFGSVPVGTTKSETIELKNSGTTSVTVSSATVSGRGFALHGITTPLVLAAGKMASMTLSYTPAVLGYVTGSISIASNASNKSLMVVVSGTGVKATRTLTVTPASLSFGNEIVGSSHTLAVTLKNTGNSSVLLSGVAKSGAGITTSGAGASGTTIAPGQTATVDVTFAPKTVGSVSGSVKVANNATNSLAATIAVSGAGVAASTLTAAPTSGPFGSVSMGTTKSETIELKNSGTTSVTVSSATVSGRGFALHGITTPLVLAAGKTASMTLSYTPAVLGYVAGSVSIASNASNKSLMVVVSGTGVKATRTLTVTPASLSFGNEIVGSSHTLAVTLKNTGNSSVLLSGVAKSGAGITTSGAGASGTTIAPGQTATVDVTFAPKTVGSVSGSVKVANNATNSLAATIAVSGAGVAASTLTAAPASQAFGSVSVGTTKSQTIELKNSGTTSVTVSSATVSGRGFALHGITTPLVLAAGKTASMTLSYTPAVSGYVAGSVSIASNALNKSLMVVVSGTGVTATRTLAATPASLSFGNETVGSSHTLAVTLKNTGNSSVLLSGVTKSGTGITTSGGASGTTIAPGQTATVDVTFAPTTVGSVSGSVKVTSNATNSPATIGLTGDGIAASKASALTATPASASFGNVPIGTTNSQTVKLENSGSSSVTVSSATVSGKGFALHGITTPLVLAGGKSANITLNYAPTVTGYVAGTVSIESNASNKTLTMTVTGTGETATRTLTATPASLSFGNEIVGSSHTLAVTLKNTGNSSVLLSGVTKSGTGITTSGGASGATIAPGQTATVDVTFAPKTAGSVSGSVKVTSNATNSPATIALTGDGVAASAHSVILNWDASSSAGIIGYHVYRAIGTNAYARLVASPVSGLNYTDTTVTGGTTYKYAVTAVDSAGMESAYSTPVSVTVP